MRGRLDSPVQGGWDTDSNGATAGSIAGVFLGAQELLGRFVVAGLPDVCDNRPGHSPRFGGVKAWPTQATRGQR